MSELSRNIQRDLEKFAELVDKGAAEMLPQLHADFGGTFKVESSHKFSWQKGKVIFKIHTGGWFGTNILKVDIEHSRLPVGSDGTRTIREVVVGTNPVLEDRIQVTGQVLLPAYEDEFKRFFEDRFIPRLESNTKGTINWVLWGKERGSSLLHRRRVTT